MKFDRVVFLLDSESHVLVDIYTLQLLHVFIESLAMAHYDDSSMGRYSHCLC
jgi:hypothetical protein